MVKFFQKLVANLPTLLLAFVLSIVVWISAIFNTDPFQERTYTREITVIGQDDNLLLVNPELGSARISVRAPASILAQIANQGTLLQAVVDLAGLESGQHAVPIRVRRGREQMQLLEVEPDEVEIALEQVVSTEMQVEMSVIGDPAIGYRKGTLKVDPEQVTISGPRSKVEEVQAVFASLDIAGASESINTSIQLQALDERGQPVEEVAITPRVISVNQPINLLGGFKTVVVKVVTEGQPAPGYRLTHVSVTPPTVTVFSSNPQLVNQLPGYVETLPLNLEGLNDDIDVRMEVSLPEGVSLVGEQSVLVQVGVAAIEGSLRVTLPVETLGLSPALQAEVSPNLVDVLVSGPLPILDTLTSSSFRIVVDLTGLGPGVYQLRPVLDLLPEQVDAQNILPDTVQVIISEAATPTPAGTGEAARTATPTPNGQ